MLTQDGDGAWGHAKSVGGAPGKRVVLGTDLRGPHKGARKSTAIMLEGWKEANAPDRLTAKADVFVKGG